MGHIFILCGPPGSGKTTLLKMLTEKGLPLKQLQRITTREQRPEEGDRGKTSLEYEFLTQGEFTGRLARGNVANFIEWNQNYYATDISRLEKALSSAEDYVLHEDMPSAVHLKRRFGSRVTIVLLFTDDRDELLRIEYAAISETGRSSVLEWQQRLGLKYADAMKLKGHAVSESERLAYIQAKMRRAFPDLAFMVGRIGDGEDIRVIPNRTDKQHETVLQFQQIVDEVKQKRVGARKFAFVLMPFGDVRSDRERDNLVNFDKLYSFVIKPAVEDEGITCWRGDEISTRPYVLEDVIHHIETAQFIIVDISGGNPNVFLELGMCLKLEKDIILISRDEDNKVPFNARNLRRIKYEDNSRGWKKLYDDIRDCRRTLKNRDSLQ